MQKENENVRLEHFHKLCSVRPGPYGVAVLLVFGCVLARSQGAMAMLPRQSLAKNQKPSLRIAT